MLNNYFKTASRSLMLAEYKTLVEAGGKKVYETGERLADSNFFRVFRLTLMPGSAAAPLNDPGSIVLSREMATDKDHAWIINQTAPITYYFMTRWLEGFAYRVGISWWIFALAGTAAVVIALLTVGYQTLRAALANPVKSLRAE